MVHPVTPESRRAPHQERYVTRQFKGMNTQAYRTSIADDQFAWLEDVMPIGSGNLYSCPAPSAALQSVTGGNTCTAMYGYNIAGNDYMLMLASNGAADQILLTAPYTLTVIGAPGTFNVASFTMSQWKNERIVMTDSVNGYRDWNGAALTLLDATKTGSSIGVFAGRVWIGNNRTVSYTDAGAYNSFLGSGGSFILTDPTLHSSIQAMASANNFLYIFGVDSINTISDVRVVGGAAVFTNTPIQTSIGTNYPPALFSYYRAVMYANKFGFYALYGATPKKISAELDGVFKYITTSNAICGGPVMINNILCAAFMFTYVDPLSSSRPLVALYFDDKWFVSGQFSTMTFVEGVNVSGVPNLYATNGTSIFQLFADAETGVAQTVRSKLYDGGDPVIDKYPVWVGIEAITSDALATFVISQDSEYTSTSTSLTAANSIIFVGSGVITFVGSGAITFISAGFAYLRGTANGYGKYFGMQVTTSTKKTQIASMQWQYKEGADA